MKRYEDIKRRVGELNKEFEKALEYEKRLMDRFKKLGKKQDKLEKIMREVGEDD